MRIICAVLALQFCIARLLIPTPFLSLLLPSALIPLFSHPLEKIVLLLSSLPTLLCLGWRPCCLKLLLSLMMLEIPALSAIVWGVYLGVKHLACSLQVGDLIVTCWLVYFHWTLSQNSREAKSNFKEAEQWRQLFMQSNEAIVIGDDFYEMQKNKALAALEKTIEVPNWKKERQEKSKILIERGTSLMVACYCSRDPFWIWSVGNSLYSQELSMLKKSIFDSTTTLAENMERLIYTSLILTFIQKEHASMDPRIPLVLLAIEQNSKMQININLGVSSPSSCQSESTRILCLIFFVCKFFRSLKIINKVNILCVEDSISLAGEKTKPVTLIGNKRNLRPAGAALSLCLHHFEHEIVENNKILQIKVKVKCYSRPPDLWMQDLNSKIEHISHLINKLSTQMSIISSKDFIRNLNFIDNVNYKDQGSILEEIDQEEKLEDTCQRFYTPNIPCRKTDAELRNRARGSFFSHLGHRSVSTISKATKTLQISCTNLDNPHERKPQIKKILIKLYKDIYLQHVMGTY